MHWWKKGRRQRVPEGQLTTCSARFLQAATKLTEAKKMDQKLSTFNREMTKQNCKRQAWVCLKLKGKLLELKSYWLGEVFYPLMQDFSYEPCPDPLAGGVLKSGP
jgi:hypothetical protein